MDAVGQLDLEGGQRLIAGLWFVVVTHGRGHMRNSRVESEVPREWTPLGYPVAGGKKTGWTVVCARWQPSPGSDYFSRSPLIVLEVESAPWKNDDSVSPILTARDVATISAKGGPVGKFSLDIKIAVTVNDDDE